MIAVNEAFSPSYARARVQFLEAAASAGMAIESHTHPLPGRDGEVLAMDVARDGAMDADKLLIISSACHGAEGYCGSGVQVFALHDQEWQDKARDAGVAKPDVRIFQLGARAAGVAAAEVLHVGDDALLDAQGALDAGMQAVWLRRPAEGFIFVFRGSPSFIQFFLAYEALVMLPRAGIQIFGLTVETAWLTKAWAGALIVLTLNTAAYSAQIFHGALMTLPKGEIEAADAYGITGWGRFRRIIWPTMMRLAWPSYTNEAIFLTHATTLVFFSGFPAFQQKGDALYYASYFADKTFNPFVAYPIVGAYFIVVTLALTGFMGMINRRLNRHLPGAARRIRYRPQIIR